MNTPELNPADSNIEQMLEALLGASDTGASSPPPLDNAAAMREAPPKEPQPKAKTAKEAALKLLRMGVSVFRLLHRSKKPLASWKRYQSEFISEAELNTWPEQTNFGMVTGAFSGIAVIDADSAEAAEYVERTWPTPWSQMTSNDRKHFIYKYPGSKVPTKAGFTIAAGLRIDIRGEGGYIVGPNSVHPDGSVYTTNGWAGTPKDLPLFPLEILGEPEKGVAMTSGGRSVLIDRSRKYLASIEPPVEGQGSDAKTYRVLCRLMGRGKNDIGLTEDEMLPLLEEWQPHFDGEWWLSKIRNSRKYGQNTEPNGAPPESVTLTRASDVEPEIIEWLWEPRMPLGNITMLEGDPGIGKSSIAAVFAADVSQSRNGFRQGSVLWFSAEDSLADTLVPRLMAANADLTRVHLSDRPFSLDNGGVDTLRSFVEQHNPALVVIDPLFAYLSGKTNVNADNEIREPLSALKQIAAEYRFALLLVRHLTKAAKDKAIYRGSGSMGITGAARSVLLAGCDLNEKSECALIHIKCNIAEKAPALGYTLESCTVTHKDKTIKTARIAWSGETDVDAAAILGSEFLLKPEKLSAIDEAVEWLREHLMKNNEVSSKGLLASAERFGIRKRTLDRAKSKLGVISEKRGSGWLCRLPEAERTPEGSQLLHAQQ